MLETLAVGVYTLPDKAGGVVQRVVAAVTGSVSLAAVRFASSVLATRSRSGLIHLPRATPLDLEIDDDAGLLAAYVARGGIVMHGKRLAQAGSTSLQVCALVGDRVVYRSGLDDGAVHGADEGVTVGGGSRAPVFEVSLVTDGLDPPGAGDDLRFVVSTWVTETDGGGRAPVYTEISSGSVSLSQLTCGASWLAVQLGPIPAGADGGQRS